MIDSKINTQNKRLRLTRNEEKFIKKKLKKNSLKRSYSNVELITHMENGIRFTVYGLVYEDFTGPFINGEHTLWVFRHSLATDAEFEGVIQVLIIKQLETKE